MSGPEVTIFKEIQYHQIPPVTMVLHRTDVLQILNTGEACRRGAVASVGGSQPSKAPMKSPGM